MSDMPVYNIDELDGIYQDVFYMINLRKKADRIAFFEYWLKENLGGSL